MDGDRRGNAGRSSGKRQGQINGGKRKTQKKTVDRAKDVHNRQGQSVDLDQSSCAFCHSSKESEGSGPLQAYVQGKQVIGSVNNSSKVIHVHLKCFHWAPMVYFENGVMMNLESEIARANKLKCSSCGIKGAGLGCCIPACPKTYHVPCAYDIPGCRWDDGYLLLCPKHASCKFQSELQSESKLLNPSTKSLKAGMNLVFCGSTLSKDEKFTLVEFASSIGAVVSKDWRDDVTHVIAATDSSGACTRTSKVLMAILNGRWILTVEWVKACMEAKHLVKEEPYEVHLDNHGSNGGPKAGRIRVQNKAPKLLNNFRFYFVGEFVQAYKADLLTLVRTAGGIIIETKDELSLSSDVDTKANVNQVTLVVYNADFSDNFGIEDEDSMKFQRLAAAEDVAQQFGGQVVKHIWILETIACGLPPSLLRY